MADSAASFASLLKTLECPVCLLTYDQVDRLPQTLRCGHTFCKYCLDGLASGSVVKCPKCRDDTPTRDVRTNFTVTEMLDALCAECKEKGKDVHCSHCGKNLCKSCFDDHRQSFPSEINSKIELLKEEIETIADISRDTSLITAEIVKADVMLRKIRMTFLEYHEFLQTCQMELEEKVCKLKKKNISSVLSRKKHLNDEIKMSTVFVDKTESAAVRASSLVTPDEMITFNEECSRFTDKMRILREVDCETVDYSYHEKKDVAQLRCSDVGEIVSPDYRSATVRRVAGGEGDGMDQFHGPGGVAVNADGYIIVTDERNHRVKVCDNKLQCLSTFGTAGNGTGEFHFPTGVAVGPDGKVYVSDYNNRIQVLTMAGHSVIKSEDLGLTDLDYPDALAFDNDGNLYICDRKNHRIQVVKQDGTHVRTIGSRGIGLGEFNDEPVGVAVTQDHKVLVGHDNTIKVFDTSGNYIESFPTNAPAAISDMEPRGMAIDRVGNIIIADYKGRLVVLDKDGKFVCVIGSEEEKPGLMKELCGITVDGQGNIIVSDRCNDRLKMVDVPGN